MKPRIRGIHIPRPCAENWDSMDRAEGTERYCSRCEHCVTDFTGKTDREIIERVLASDGRMCGRFTETQLERLSRFQQPEPRPAPWRSALLTLAGVACTVPPATAEVTLQPPAVVAAAQPTGPADEKGSQESSAAQETASETSALLKGRVVRVSDGQPLAGVDVGIVETSLSTTTDTEGRFQIDLGSLADPPRRIVLMITHDGYIPVELSFSTAGAPLEIPVQMHEDGQVVGDVITVGGVEPLFVSVHERLWRPLRLLEDRWRRSDRHGDTPGPLSPRPDG